MGYEEADFGLDSFTDISDLTAINFLAINLVIIFWVALFRHKWTNFWFWWVSVIKIPKKSRFGNIFSNKITFVTNHWDNQRTLTFAKVSAQFCFSLTKPDNLIISIYVWRSLIAWTIFRCLLELVGWSYSPLGCAKFINPSRSYCTSYRMLDSSILCRFLCKRWSSVLGILVCRFHVCMETFYLFLFINLYVDLFSLLHSGCFFIKQWMLLMESKLGELNPVQI